VAAGALELGDVDEVDRPAGCSLHRDEVVEPCVEDALVLDRVLAQVCVAAQMCPLATTARPPITTNSTRCSVSVSSNCWICS
jgi:hypothetical protein